LNVRTQSFTFETFESEKLVRRFSPFKQQQQQHKKTRNCVYEAMLIVDLTMMTLVDMMTIMAPTPTNTQTMRGPHLHDSRTRARKRPALSLTKASIATTATMTTFLFLCSSPPSSSTTTKPTVAASDLLEDYHGAGDTISSINNSLDDDDDDEEAEECGLYLAPSTIPGAGLGMYAGNKPIKEGDHVVPEPNGGGDVIIPIFEMEWHAGCE
jgi:hypothetical protein